MRDPEFELWWAIGLIVALAEWALAMLGTLWIGLGLTDPTVLILLLVMLLWPTILPVIGGNLRDMEVEESGRGSG